MLALESLVRALPLVIRLGLIVIAFGGLADLVTHLSFADAADPGGHTQAQLSAHAIAFAGMVLVLAGVVVDGVRQSMVRRRGPGRQPTGGD
jgi:flagellar biosynthesis protein FliR